MKKEYLYPAFVSGLVVGSLSLVLLMIALPKEFRIYQEGVRDTQREAYENGHMVKEVSKDDEVIYRWRHLEKIGYEEDQ
jgi:hypothetical protein